MPTVNDEYFLCAVESGMVIAKLPLHLLGAVTRRRVKVQAPVRRLNLISTFFHLLINAKYTKAKNVGYIHPMKIANDVLLLSYLPSGKCIPNS